MNKRNSILIIPALIPYPLVDGGKICIYGFIDYMRKDYDISIILNCTNQADQNNAILLQTLWPNVKIHYKVPAPKKNTLPQIIKVITKKILTFLKSKIQNRSSFDGMNIYRTTPSIPAPLHYYELIANVLSNSKYDIIQTELTETLKLVHLLPQDTKKVFVQIENRGQIIYDYGKVNGIKEGYLSYVVKNTEFLEYSYMALYDAILTLNATDCSIIQKVLPNTKVYNSPFSILDKDIAEPPQFLDFKLNNLIFIGSENHYPNLDGLEWFLSNSKHYLSRKEIEKIFVTGKWSEQTKTRLYKLENRVEFTGFVEDLSSLLKKSISIVPIRIGGGGIRTKILHSMAQCSPVVSTTIAAIGIAGEQKEYLKIGDTIESFMDSIKFFLNKNEETIQLINAANELISVCPFSKNTYAIY